MKIYANTENPVDRFVGKDLWVDVAIIMGHFGKMIVAQHKYFKITDKVETEDGESLYVGNSIYENFIDSGASYTTYEELYSEGGAEKLLHLPEEAAASDVILKKPTTVFTTEDLISIIDDIYDGIDLI